MSCTPEALSIACGEGSLRVTRIQPEGKNPMGIDALLNGRPGLFSAGMTLEVD